MKTCIRSTAVLGLPAAVVSCLLLNPAIAAASVVSPLPESDYTVRHCMRGARPRVCRVPGAGAGAEDGGGTRTCPSAGDHDEVSRSTAAKASEGAFGLRPQDLHSIYQLPTTVAPTQTIALVDAYNDLSAEADLKVYDEEFGLPECTDGANKCFQQVNQKGQNAQTGNPPFPASTEEREKEETNCTTGSRKSKEAACKKVEEADGWSEEISLDIEVSHATCESCKIVLVEADSASFADLEEAEKAAVALGATEISNSWGGPEQEVTASRRQRQPLQPSRDRDHRRRRRRRLPGLGRRTRKLERASPTTPPPPHTWSRWAAPACWARSAPGRPGRARRSGTAMEPAEAAAA